MFEDCLSLISLPDISNWNINKIYKNKENNIFSNCLSLVNPPKLNISRELSIPEKGEELGKFLINYIQKTMKELNA